MSTEHPGATGSLAGQRGQASIEWLALICLVALLFTAIVATGLRPPGTALATSLAERMLCAVGAGACGETPVLVAAYGPEVAAEIRRLAPGLAFERGETTMPVDFRICRKRPCAGHDGTGHQSRTASGGKPVAFTRVIDCRGANEDAGCTGQSGPGSLYVQYWFYYPDSSTFEGVPVLEERGFHRHDWESYQVRIGPDSRVDARASSHHGHNHRQGMVNWASDAGLGPLNALIERTGIRPSGGWGEASGWLFVTAGSHAGNVRGRPLRVTAYTEPDDLRLIPIESVADDTRQPDFTPITPPWKKRLWGDPEEGGTS